MTNRVPVVPGGGTVMYVNPTEHRYLDDQAHREEGGTPAIVESIRAGLVFQLKQAVGVETIQAHEEELLRRAVEAWVAEPTIQILGNLDSQRLSIVSFVIKAPDGSYLHHNFVVALLNDLFGIQTRGGCSCAGPYGHRLLDIDLDTSHQFEAQIAAGARASSRAGCGSTSTTSSTRRSSPTSWRRCASWPARGGGCSATTASTRSPGCGTTAPDRWSRRCASRTWRTPPTAAMTWPSHTMTAPASVLREHLDEGRAIMAAASPPDWSDAAHLGADFDGLRWFALPACSLG